MFRLRFFLGICLLIACSNEPSTKSSRAEVENSPKKTKSKSSANTSQIEPSFGSVSAPPASGLTPNGQVTNQLASIDQSISESQVNSGDPQINPEPQTKPGGVYRNINRTDEEAIVDDPNQGALVLKTLGGSVGGQTTDGERLNRKKGDLRAYDFCGGDNSILDEETQHTVEILSKFLAEKYSLQNCKEQAIPTLKSVKELSLRKQQIKDVSPLSEMSSLEKLDLSENEIFEDPYALWDLKKLEVLYMAHNQLTSINGLSGMNQLRMLDVSDNKITNISVLSSLPSLTHLNIANNSVVSVLPLVDKDIKINYAGNPNIVSKIPMRPLLKPPDCQLTGVNMKALGCVMSGIPDNPFFKNPLAVGVQGVGELLGK